MYRKIIYLLLFLLLLTTPLFPERLVKISSISCQNQHTDCHESIKQAIGKFEGKTLWAVKKNINLLAMREKRISKYNTQFKLPDKLIINVIEKLPKYAVTNNLKKQFLLVDSEGSVLEVADMSELPLLINDQLDVKNKSNIGQNNLKALELIEDASRLFGVIEGKIENGSLVIEVPGNLRVILPIEGDRDVLIGSLVLITAKLENSGDVKSGKTAFSTLDLRYENPVLR